MIQAPKTVTAEGDIHIHNKGGAVINIKIKDDTTGAAVNVSARNFFFVTTNGIRVALTNGSTVDEKVLTLQQEQLESLINNPAQFVVVDESSVPHQIHWEGRLTVRGWA